MKRLIAFSALGFLLLGQVALAEAPRSYSPAAMAAAQSAGKPVIVHVTATWCSTCAAQMPIVLSLLNEPKYKDVVLLNVDFDKAKDVLRKLHVQAQSTFVVFKGRQEVGRSVGETDKASIESLFEKAV